MTEQEIWTSYILEYSCYKNKHYEAWCYGGDIPDLLEILTVSGTKTATASTYSFYEYEKCELVKVGEHNIILDINGSAACITKTTRVTVVSFLQVSAEQAYKEGEGDRSLQYRRTVHAKVLHMNEPKLALNFQKICLLSVKNFKWFPQSNSWVRDREKHNLSGVQTFEVIK